MAKQFSVVVNNFQSWLILRVVIITVLYLSSLPYHVPYFLPNLYFLFNFLQKAVRCDTHTEKFD